jgi:CelD/BcsL family acetyltransferase involved in cellulose biosynthesis/GNAT superfamily N-acetyltransferase
MRIEVIQDTEALATLAAAEFEYDWQRLFDACPWATGYQTLAFARSWYDVYASEWDPLLLVGREGDRIAGILALAVAKDGRTCANVGSHQAEYHSWLSSSDDSAQFIDAALSELGRCHPKASLSFHFLPPGLDPSAITRNPRWQSLAAARSEPRPILLFDEQADPGESFRKKSNKSRLNRLKRHGGGDVTFRELGSAEDLAGLIDLIADHYDLRQGAANDSTPFHDDLHKKRFYVDLMEKGLLHAGILFAGETMAAAILSMKNRDCVSIGVFAHSPSLARHSPGKFAVLYLSLALRKGGFRYLDITPGGDWKDRFANTQDQVYDLTVRFDATAARAHRLSENARRVAKRALGVFGATPADARGWVATARRITPTALVRHVHRLLVEQHEFRVYRLPALGKPSVPEEDGIVCNRIGHLLQFAQTEPWLSRQSFLARALKRLENGERIYTIAEDGLLLHYGWLCDRQKESFFTEVEAGFTFPDNSAVLYDYYTHPAARGQGYYQRSIARMIADASAVPGTEWIYISVLADNGASRHVIEKLGFAYQGSLYLKKNPFRTIRVSDFRQGKA